MKFASVGEGTVYNIYFEYNKLRASEHGDETRSCYVIFRACCLGTQFWELIITKHFDETLLKHFRMTKLAFQMLCNEIGPLVGQFYAVPLQSHIFFDAQ